MENLNNRESTEVTSIFERFGLALQNIAELLSPEAAAEAEADAHQGGVEIAIGNLFTEAIQAGCLPMVEHALRSSEVYQ